MKKAAAALNSAKRVTVPHPRPRQDVSCDTLTVLRGGVRVHLISLQWL